MACLLTAKIVKPTQTADARQWLSSRHVMTETDTDATIK
jgi:hypothetical protein